MQVVGVVVVVVVVSEGVGRGREDWKARRQLSEVVNVE
jgi:hypothetical protein